MRLSVGANGTRRLLKECCELSKEDPRCFSGGVRGEDEVEGTRSCGDSENTSLNVVVAGRPGSRGGAFV